MAVTEPRKIYSGTRIPAPIPTTLQVPVDLVDPEDVLQVNFGPNHPSTHGVLRLVVDLSGERVVGLRAVIGYLHTGFEKNMEQKTWWKAITYPERIDYVSFQNNELVFVLAIEKLLEIDVPPKATWMRMLLCELNRIHSHLVHAHEVPVVDVAVRVDGDVEVERGIREVRLVAAQVPVDTRGAQHRA